MAAKQALDTRDWLYGYELCRVCKISVNSLLEAQRRGLIPATSTGPHKHGRFPASVAVTIANLKAKHGRNWVQASAPPEMTEDRSVTFEFVPEPDPEPTPTPRTHLSDDTLMLFGIDERLKAVEATLTRIAVALERCAAAWER